MIVPQIGSASFDPNPKCRIRLWPERQSKARMPSAAFNKHRSAQQDPAHMQAMDKWNCRGGIRGRVGFMVYWDGHLLDSGRYEQPDALHEHIGMGQLCREVEDLLRSEQFTHVDPVEHTFMACSLPSSADRRLPIPIGTSGMV